MTIHSSDPFASPDDSPVRRLRGRLASAVTLWTAYDDGRPTGLTVGSTELVDGDPARLIGLLDEESTLWTAARRSGRFAVIPLRQGDAQLADQFAGLFPAPGGLFSADLWEQSPFGPVLSSALTWAGCRFDDSQPLGWSQLVRATVLEVAVGPAEADLLTRVGPLVRYRGRYLAGNVPGAAPG